MTPLFVGTPSGYLMPLATISSTTVSILFFFNDTATTEIYTLSLHDALPICDIVLLRALLDRRQLGHQAQRHGQAFQLVVGRSEEHTSELQSLRHLVCRLLLEKKK